MARASKRTRKAIKGRLTRAAKSKGLTGTRKKKYVYGTKGVIKERARKKRKRSY